MGRDKWGLWVLAALLGSMCDKFVLGGERGRKRGFFLQINGKVA